MAQRLAALIQCFSHKRRVTEDVFWLKENAELLNILECTEQRVAPSALTAFEPFYAGLEDRFAFFPQYYRFLLSIALDLEDLGMPGDKAAGLIDSALRSGLAETELSDLQRGEANRLFARRGQPARVADPGLNDRLRGFCRRGATFALPNKKAAYELTHIVFYLSEYGRRDPELDDVACRSLDYAGTLAYLDQNADLLAEICIALRYAGRTPPQLWESWIGREAAGFVVTEGGGMQLQDDYHAYFTCNWLQALAGRDCFCFLPDGCRAQFMHGSISVGPLRSLSENLFAMGPRRRDDWHAVRDQIYAMLDPGGQDILMEAEANCSDFSAFFEIFARATTSRARLPWEVVT